MSHPRIVSYHYQLRCCSPPTTPLLQKTTTQIFDKMKKHFETTKQKTRRLRRVVTFFCEKGSKTKDVGKTRCSCIQVGVSSLAFCVCTIVKRRGALQHSIVFHSSELGDVRDTSGVRKASGAGARSIRSGAPWGVVPKPLWCVGGFFCREDNAQNETHSAHVLSVSIHRQTRLRS